MNYCLPDILDIDSIAMSDFCLCDGFLDTRS